MLSEDEECDQHLHESDQVYHEFYQIPCDFKVFKKTLRLLRMLERQLESSAPMPEYEVPTLWYGSDVTEEYMDGVNPFKEFPWEFTRGCIGWGEHHWKIHIISTRFWDQPSSEFLDAAYKPRYPSIVQRLRLELVPRQIKSITEFMEEFSSDEAGRLVFDPELLNGKGYWFDVHLKGWDLWLPHGESEQPILDAFEHKGNNGNTRYYTCKTPNYTYAIYFSTS